ncbi:MAG: M23 family metallopeptidase [Lachnospiraceae bacterium]|nr:M23 family metallopeptidase [Lachnospiraceae bacterium]
MKKKHKYYRRIRVSFLQVAVAVIFLNVLFLPSFKRIRSSGDNYFEVKLNGVLCGHLGTDDNVKDLLKEARLSLAAEQDEILYSPGALDIEGSEVVFARVDSDEDVIDSMKEVLKQNEVKELKDSYTVKIGEYIVKVASLDDVRSVLNAAIDVYDEKNEFDVQLSNDQTRELNSLAAEVVTRKELKDDEKAAVKTAGIETLMAEELKDIQKSDDDKSFDDFEYGIMGIEFADKIEIVESYLSEDQLVSVDEAVSLVTTAQEKDAFYEVQSGDTLSQIAEKVNIPMDKIIALNDSLDNENSMIRAGEELIITMPEPPLSVDRVEQQYIEEDYDADVIYIDNDEWYTTQEVTRQAPSAGHRNIVAKITYHNTKEVNKEVIKEEVILAAIPKIVEKGTKIPPTYVKPISGGRLSSGFGRRSAPTRGASTYHKGVDWAVPVGTAVYASCGGTVTKAGWGSGYGYCVYISHPDGRETRYGHLSKVLVSSGQSVKQGQKIALSGNTGRSTGPHLHFEIRIGGSAVNPLKYLE